MSAIKNSDISIELAERINDCVVYYDGPQVDVAAVANILIEAGVVSPPVRILRSQFGVLDRTYLFADDNEAQSHASPGDSSEHYRGQTN